MMEITDKLKQHTKEIHDIMLLAQSSFKIVDYLTREREGFEINIVNHSLYFKYSAEVNWRIYVIEMAKLFSTSHKAHWFNLNRFIEKFKPGGEYASVREIDHYSVKIWEQNLDLEKIKIENLLKQRDKLYSHTDKNRANIKNELTYLEARELLNIVKRILSEIYASVFDEFRLYDLSTEPVDDLKKLIKELSLLEQARIDYLLQHAKDKEIDLE